MYRSDQSYQWGTISDKKCPDTVQSSDASLMTTWMAYLYTCKYFINYDNIRGNKIGDLAILEKDTFSKMFIKINLDSISALIWVHTFD